MLLLLDQDGYWHCDLWFFVLIWTITGITKFYKLWPKIYVYCLLGHDGYYHFQGLWPKLLLYHFFGNDGCCLIYVILCSCVSLTIGHSPYMGHNHGIALRSWIMDLFVLNLQPITLPSLLVYVHIKIILQPLWLSWIGKE